MPRIADENALRTYPCSQAAWKYGMSLAGPRKTYAFKIIKLTAEQTAAVNRIVLKNICAD